MTLKCETVPLVEAARMIARRLSGGLSDTFTQEARREADGVLKRALREVTIKSWGLPPGWPDQRERRVLLPREWQTLEAMIDDCGLRPAGSQRRGRVDWIEDIEVDAKDLDGLVAALPPASNDLTTPAATPTELAIQPAQPSHMPVSRSATPSEVEARRILKALRGRLAPRHPTDEEDRAAIEIEYPGSPRSHARKARAALAPSGGYKAGPKGPRKSNS